MAIVFPFKTTTPLLCLFFVLDFTFISSFAHIIPKFPSPRVSIELQENSPSAQNELYKTKFFTQILDHFDYNPQSYQTFQQRYLINDTHWGGAKKKAPIFVYTGNEGDIEWFTQNTGFMFDIAPYFKALLVFIEILWKIDTIWGNKQVANANSSTLGFLSSTQALADYATLIIDLKKNLSAIDSPVVVFGGSYGGMLAAWFRMKYPHVAIGALASSAPILHFVDLVSPYVFNDIVTQDFKSESEHCYQVIKGSWKLIQDMTNKQGGWEQLQKSFRICKNDMGAKAGVSALLDWLMTAWTYTAMTDYPTPSNFTNPLPAYPVRKMCGAIDNSITRNDPLAKLNAAANIYYNYSGTTTCFDLDDHSDLGLGGWSWQSCTEMIMPIGANNKSIFPESEWSYEGVFAYCQHNVNITPRPHWITTEFGGHDIKRVLKRFASNIIFFNGLRDPWSGGGVLKSISKSLVAIVAEEGAHHVDLRYSTKEDPKWLKDVREQEVKILEDWISQYYQDLKSSD